MRMLLESPPRRQEVEEIRLYFFCFYTNFCSFCKQRKQPLLCAKSCFKDWFAQTCFVMEESPSWGWEQGEGVRACFVQWLYGQLWPAQGITGPLQSTRQPQTSILLVLLPVLGLFSGKALGYSTPKEEPQPRTRAAASLCSFLMVEADEISSLLHFCLRSFPHVPSGLPPAPQHKQQPRHMPRAAQSTPRFVWYLVGTAGLWQAAGSPRRTHEAESSLPWWWGCCCCCCQGCSVPSLPAGCI